MLTPKQFNKLAAGIGVHQRRNATPQPSDADKLVGKSQRRDTTFDARDLKLADDAQVISVTFSSEAPVYRNIGGFSFYEILDHSPQAAADFRRLNSGGQFIRNHDINQVMGVVEDGSAKIDSAIRKGCADLRFSERPDAQLERVDVLKGVRRNFSFDYEVTAPYIDTTKKIAGLPVLRAMAWRVLSICTETHAADITVGHGPDRRAHEHGRTQQRGLGCSCACCTPGNPQPCCCCCPNLTSAPLSCNCACCQSYYPRPCCCCCDELSETPAQDAAEITAGERRRTNIMCNARSAAECKTHNCTLHPDADKRAAQQPPTPTPEQVIAQRQAELTGWAGVFGDTPEQVAEFTQLARDYGRDATKATIELPALTDMFKAAIEKAKTAARAAVNTAKPPQGVITVPGRRTSSLRVFKGEGGDLRAYRYWNGLLANAFYGRAGHERFPAIKRAYDYAKDNGLLQRAAEGQSEGVNEDGGFTVQEEWSPDTISLVEEFGVIRRYAKIEPMAAEAKNIRRREGGLQFHAAGEAEDVEIEKKKWGGNKLVAKKWLCLANLTSEVNEDSAVNQADDLAYEMGLADARLEDDLGFLADGTGDDSNEKGYQGVLGIIPKLLNIKLSTGAAATIAQTAGLVVAHGSPTKPEQVPLVLGDLRMGTILGDRSPLTIAMSTESSFRNDTIDLKGRVRLDFIAHSVGNADATATKRKAGPIVALITDDWDSVTSDHLNTLMGRLPRYPGIKPVFFCHQTFYFQVLRKILIAAGGATVAELAGAGPFQFGGYPVEFCQNLPAVEVA